jgi:hypothetical protein
MILSLIITFAVLAAVVAFLRWALTEADEPDEGWTLRGELVAVGSVPFPPRTAWARPQRGGLELVDSAAEGAPARYAWSLVTVHATPRAVVLTGPYGIFSSPATTQEPAAVVLLRLTAVSGLAPADPPD